MKKKIVSVLLLTSMFFILAACGFSGTGKEEAIDAAEKYTKKEVYTALGVVPERFSSEVIYSETVKDIDYYLIVVKYYLDDSSNPGGSICAYCSSYVKNATDIMAPEYPYKQHLEELKALFGI